jgi:putative copper resistance protein D
MAGSAAAALDPNTISAVLFNTSFGRVWCSRLLFAFLLIGACLAPLARRRMPAILVLSLLLLVSLGWVGHAVEGQGVASLVHQINRFRLLPRLRREPSSSAPIGALARCSSSRRSVL